MYQDEDPSLLISAPEISSEPDKKPSNTEDHDHIAQIAKKRLEEIDNLRSERIRLTWEIDDLKVKVRRHRYVSLPDSRACLPPIAI